ncbi:hypothetical protein RQP46_007731 [Phenoliferia psychrophenolica]
MDLSSPSSAGSASPAAQEVPAATTGGGGGDGGGAGGGAGGGSPAPSAKSANDGDDLDSSFFPAPAVYYKRYTTANLALPLDAAVVVPGEEPACTRADLEPPNPAWVVERGNYSVFGETWPVEEVLPSLEDMGVKEMFARGADRTTSLQTLLQALLVSYTTLISALLSPPPSLPSLPPPGPNGELPPTEPERLVEHIRLISINMHHLVNELRPVQARETLKTMMRSQIETRRAKTAAMKQKCAELRATLATLKTDLTTSSLPSPTTVGIGKSSGSKLGAEDDAARLRAAVDALDSMES